ncbi:MAG: HNH endonuclease, partial [Actinomycetota bacterium]|nr:HNH endonuclease [Actinomycetota bacterium]
LDRDRTCLVPGCGATHHLEIHHLIPWARGGRTDTANLGALCTFHHNALHRGELTITGNANNPTNLLFIDNLGRVIPSFVPPAPPSTDTPADPTNTVAATGYQHPPGERMDNRWLHFSPPPPRASAPSRQPHAPPA